nr:hypothetical protein [Tanacetum cinerariifolium]
SLRAQRGYHTRTVAKQVRLLRCARKDSLLATLQRDANTRPEQKKRLASREQVAAPQIQRKREPRARAHRRHGAQQHDAQVAAGGILGEVKGVEGHEARPHAVGPQLVYFVGGVEAELGQRGQANAAKAAVAAFAAHFGEQAGRKAHVDIEVDVAAQYQLYLLRIALIAVLPGIVPDGEDNAVPGLQVVGSRPSAAKHRRGK